MNFLVPPVGIVNGVLRVRECQDDLFQNVRMRSSGQTQGTGHNFILGQDDHHSSMYFVNKVMGPQLKSDEDDVMNEEDNCRCKDISSYVCLSPIQ
jgi:hypothetical protein